jgi:hypothetical protein
MDVPLVHERMHANRDAAMTGRWPDSGDGGLFVWFDSRAAIASAGAMPKSEGRILGDALHRKTCTPPIQV